MSHVATPVQINYNSTAQSSWTGTFTSTVPAGHTLLIFCEGSSNSGQDANFSATDSVGTTYTHRKHAPSPQNVSQMSLLDSITLSSPIPAGTTLTIAHGGVGINNFGCTVEEHDDITAFDVSQASSWSGSATGTAGTTASTTQANEVVVAGYAYSAVGGTATATSGFSISTALTYGRGNVVEWKYITAIGTQTANVGLAASCSGVGIIAAYKTTLPTQSVAPTTDRTTTGWTKVGGTGTYASCLDEAVADSSDYVQSPNNPTGSVFEDIFAPVSPPSDYTGHVLSLQMWNVSTTTQTNTIGLYEGATLRASWTQAVTTTPTVYQFTLTPTQAQSIVDYSALSFRVTTTLT